MAVYRQMPTGPASETGRDPNGTRAVNAAMRQGAYSLGGQVPDTASKLSDIDGKRVGVAPTAGV
jgi:hypothetical protein